MAISKMQQPRQQYGLGKLVKKAFKGLKKVAKSPIGKAAILGGLGMYGMGAGPFSGMKGSGFLRGMMGARNLGASKFLSSGAAGGARLPTSMWGKILGGANKLLNPWQSGKFSGKHAFGLGAAGLIAAPFIQKALGYGPYEDDEEVDEVSWTQTPQSILDIRNMARQQDPSLAFLPSANYAQSGFYAADGGRAGLVNGGEAGQAQMEQMLRAEYLKYRNQGGTMPYEQFKILVMKQAQQGQMPNQMMAANGGRAGYNRGRVVNPGGYSGMITMDEIAADFLKEFGYDMSLASDKVRANFIDDYKNKEGWYDDVPLAQGGRAGYLFGERVEKERGFIEGPQGDEEFSETLMASDPSWEDEWDQIYEMYKAKQIELGLDFVDKETFIMDYQDNMAQGGRAGYYGGELVEQETDLIEGPQGGEEFQETVVEGQEQPSREQLEALAMEIFNTPLEELDDQQLLVVYQEAMQGQPMEESVQAEDVQFAANGGRMGFQMGGDDDDELTYNPYQAMDMYKRTRRQEGGLMDLGGHEKDYRDEGGFVALGGEERADDVPARLSKNEFVFTADAVRNAGGGDIDAGSEVMQNVMDNLEQGGEVSEDSQGLEGGEEIMSEEMVEDINPAQGMYDNYEQLQSRVA